MIGQVKEKGTKCFCLFRALLQHFSRIAFGAYEDILLPGEESLFWLRTAGNAGVEMGIKQFNDVDRILGFSLSF